MLVIAVLITLLMSALGAALTMVASSEALVAQNFSSSQEALQAAGAAAERALADLDALGDWNLALNGTVRSSFVDGPPTGARRLADGSLVDLGQIVNLEDCHRITACGAADMDAVAPDRPWGANNPRWQLFAYGSLPNVVEAAAADSPYYVVVLVGDDPSDIDSEPLRDSDVPHPGAGVVVLRAQALGPHASRRTVEVTVARGSNGHVRIVAWHPG